MKKSFLLWLCLSLNHLLLGQNPAGHDVSVYDLTWQSPSKNAGGSMPCGGGDIGLNVWVENGDMLFYIARSGTFDHNNTLLKLGRVRVKLSPNPFDKGDFFQQSLHLKEGSVVIHGKKGTLQAKITLWVDVFKPVIHVNVEANQAVAVESRYESWRYQDRITKGKENNANSYKWAPQGIVKTLADTISWQNKGLVFCHENQDRPSVFDVTVHQQGLDSVKHLLYNPLKNLSFGGVILGNAWQMTGTQTGKYLDTDYKAWILHSKKVQKQHELTLVLHTQTVPNYTEWLAGLYKSIAQLDPTKDVQATQDWWHRFWEKSFISFPQGTPHWFMARNYQLFRYQLACNATGTYPTKFNGGLFTVDASLTDSTLKFTPDFRNWGGGTHTAQNQRLVYWPMLKSGDIDMMKPQFDFYLRLLQNAELRTSTYWQHKGACFTEQLENFGLPNPAEYGWKRPVGFDKGLEYNAWLEYEWDTVLEFCQMILETERYQGKDISAYIPLIESCLQFFNEHYQYLAKKRGSKALDANKQLILFPSSGAETYKMAYNSTSTIASLQTVLQTLLGSKYIQPDKKASWEAMLQRIPPIRFRSFGGKTTIAPAYLWERINNVESPQLYPVFPWGMYGIGKAGLDTAIQTYQLDTDALKFRSHIGWKQDNIFAARLGLTAEAFRLTSLKLQDAPRRFPTFWGPGYDWTPDHNWGGSGMIGLQEMLMQTVGEKIYLLPAWDKSKNVHFKLFAPMQTTVELDWKNGQVQSLIVIPKAREKDIVW